MTAGLGHVFHRNLHKIYPLAVRGEGLYLYDAEGRSYIDACSSALAVSIGHAHPRVLGAIVAQASRLCFAHTSQFTNEPQEKLADLIAEMSPAGLNRVYFVSSGSEATETAIKLARQFHLERSHPEKVKVIGRWMSYHGNSLGALAVSGHVGRRRPYEPLLYPMPHIPPAYCYRCPFGLTYPQCELRCAESLEEALLKEDPRTVAAFIAEPIVGATAGAVPPPEGYLGRIQEFCRRYDVLFIADEVMTAFGRTGKTFAVEHWGVVPDIITVAKGLSGGYLPLGAVIVHDRVYQAIAERAGKFVHGFTYTGHPVSCAAGHAVLSVIREEGLIERAAEMEKHFFGELNRLRRFPMVGDVRGKGLMAGIEFVQDQQTGRAFPAEWRVADLVYDRAFSQGLLVYPGSGFVDGVRGDHVMVAPPLTVNPGEISLIVSKLELVIAEAMERLEEMARAAGGGAG